MKNFACIFPGQGSQGVGMAAPLMEDPLSADVFREANDALGFDITKLILEGPEEELMLTENAQPAILTTSFAAWKLLVRELGMKATPTYMAGHSLGEFSALAASGALDFEDAVRLVRKRGKFMQEAVPEGEGGMAAIIGLRDTEVLEIVEGVAQGEPLDIANLNTNLQIVISGKSSAVERAARAAKKAGAKKAVLLKVSAPFHSRMMVPAREKFAVELREYKFMTPFCPVIHNVTAWPNTEPRKIINFVEQQVDSPVRWTESIQFMLDHDIEVFIEVGYGTILQGLTRKIAGPDSKVTIAGFASPSDIGNIREVLGLEENNENDV